ncbi:MAG: hypothetical protein M3Y77_08940 [Actinomycetota bacterium]|nr:hypothetical protein [Actinomycetota bacterium]
MTTTVQPNRLTTVATRDHRPVLRRAVETEYLLAATLLASRGSPRRSGGSCVD